MGGGGGVLKITIFKGKNEAKLEFLRGGEVQTTLGRGRVGGMNIFWNNTFIAPAWYNWHHIVPLV